MDDASGALVGFPYPLHHVTGLIKVRDGYVEVVGAHAERGAASVAVDGRVSWVDASQTRLIVKVRGMPMDAELLGAIPAERRPWLTDLGINGVLDVDGTITQPKLPPAGTLSTSGGLDLIHYDLSIALREGTLHPANSEISASNVTAKLRLNPSRLLIDELHAQRGKASLAVDGSVQWMSGHPHLAFNADAREVALDLPLYHVLPESVRRAWGELQPDGSVDVHVKFEGDADSLSLDAGRHNPSIATPISIVDAPVFSAVIRPRDLAVTLKSIPYRLDHVAGAVTVTSGKVTIADVTARHGDAAVAIAGTGDIGSQLVWNLRVSGKGLQVDNSFRAALPTSLRAMVDALKLQGVSDFSLSRLVYRLPAEPPREGPAPATQPARPEPAPEIDVSAVVAIRDGSLDVGIPLEQVNGAVALDAEVRDERLTWMKGKIEVSRLSMAGRELRDFRADVLRPRDKNELQLAQMQAQLAGGAMAGQMGLLFPDDGPSRYNLDLVLRNADVRALTTSPDQDIHGSLTASLSLEGAWAIPALAAAAATSPSRGRTCITSRSCWGCFR